MKKDYSSDCMVDFEVLTLVAGEIVKKAYRTVFLSEVTKCLKMLRMHGVSSDAINVEVVKYAKSTKNNKSVMVEIQKANM